MIVLWWSERGFCEALNLVPKMPRHAKLQTTRLIAVVIPSLVVFDGFCFFRNYAIKIPPVKLVIAIIVIWHISLRSILMRRNVYIYMYIYIWMLYTGENSIHYLCYEKQSARMRQFTEIAMTCLNVSVFIQNFLRAAKLGKTTATRHTTVRETGASRHHGASIEKGHH